MEPIQAFPLFFQEEILSASVSFAFPFPDEHWEERRWRGLGEAN